VAVVESETGNWKLGFGIWNLSFYILATLASLYTHYYDVFILVAENIFALGLASFARRWKTLARWIGAQAVIVLLYAPWVLFGTNRVSTYGEASGRAAFLCSTSSADARSFHVERHGAGRFQGDIVAAARAGAHRDSGSARATKSRTRRVPVPLDCSSDARTVHRFAQSPTVLDAI